MLFQVTHRIRYIYSAAVFLEPHTIRLRPRSEVSQKLNVFSMSVEPEPAGRHDFLDVHDNCAACLWFDNQTDSLTITTSFEVETLSSNPFGYLVTDPDFFQIPVRYLQDEAFLARFRAPVESSNIVQTFTNSIISETGGRTIDFLARLCTAIYEGHKVEIRHEGPPHSPDVTLQNGRGACRDLALLFIAACRHAGLAARFVSGYQEGDQDDNDIHLHAWAEVYIPGGGWRGYDPTHGLAVADRHIALAASPVPDGAAPVTGAFRGSGVSAEMEYTITIAGNEQ